MGPNTLVFNDSDLFIDAETLASSIAGTLTVIPSATTTKYISGVEFYTLNTQWDVTITQIENLNANSYPTTNQLFINNTEFFISYNININGITGGFTNWTSQWNSTNASYTNPTWTTDEANNINWNNATGAINNTFATADIYDWGQTGTVNSVNYPYLIDTLVDSSSRNSEMFRSENYRLLSNLTAWSSVTHLNSIDSGNGLQVLGDRLVYPQYNFGIYQPDMTLQPNYVGTTGTKSYFRIFTANGSTVSNGLITFSDHNIVEADLTSNTVQFQISIDNGTTWFNLNANYLGGILSNGLGCRVNNLEYGLGVGNINSSSLNFTLGQGGSSTYIILQITYTVAAINKYIGQLDISQGNW